MSNPTLLGDARQRRGAVGKLQFVQECLSSELRRLEVFGDKGPLRLNALKGILECGDTPVSLESGAIFNYRVALADSTQQALGQALEIGETTMRAAIEGAALAASYHPVEEWVKALAWDGVDRLTGEFPACFGQAPGTLQAQFLRYSVRAMVARAIRPGCQVDTVPVLVGAQGMRKSRGLRALAGEWFGDPFIDVEAKDSWEQVHRFWLLELAELSALRSKDLEAVKAFATRSTDSFRAPYARQSKEHPRRSVFWGTTNQQEFLMDTTGQRRWWPIVIGDKRINLEWLRQHRADVFAQARAEVEGGAQWWLTDEEEEAHRAAVVPHTETDPWEPLVLEWMTENAARATMEGIAMAEILGGAVDLSKREQHPGNARRMAAILRKASAYQAADTSDRRWRW